MYKTGVLFSENSISEYIPIQEPKGYRTSPNIKTPVTRLFTAGLALNVWRMWSLFFVIYCL